MQNTRFENCVRVFPFSFLFHFFEVGIFTGFCRVFDWLNRFDSTCLSRSPSPLRLFVRIRWANSPDTQKYVFPWDILRNIASIHAATMRPRTKMFWAIRTPISVIVMLTSFLLPRISCHVIAFTQTDTSRKIWNNSCLLLHQIQMATTKFET